MSKILLTACKDYNFYNFRSELILELLKTNEVVLVCPKGDKLDFFKEKGCRIIDIQVDRRGKNPFHDFFLFKQYKKILIAEKPNLVLTYTTKSSIYCGLACSRLNIPYIVNNAGLTEISGLLKIIVNVLYKISFKNAKCLMFQNDQERDYMLHLLKNNVRFRRIPGSGVNLEKFKFKPYPNTKNMIIFNYVGRIVKTKGIKEYLECAETIHKKYPNTLFRIFGEFDDDCFSKKIYELQKENVVTLMGQQLDMEPFIAEAHACIHPSHYEGMTNVVLEHSAVGRPSIGSNIHGIKEEIDDGLTGFVFKTKNVDSLINVVEHFINLPLEEKALMGLRSRSKIEKEFDRKIVTSIYLEEISQVLEKKNERRD